MKVPKPEGKTKAVFDVHVKEKRTDKRRNGIKKFLYGENVINLRPHFRARHPWALLFIIFIVVVTTFLSVRTFFSRGEAQDFSPTTCLGTWQNPSGAEGIPETTRLPGSSFSIENSAVGAASGTEIYCGGFLPGNFSTSGVLTSVSLNLVWQVGDATSSQSAVPSEGDTSVATSSDQTTVTTTTDTATPDDEVDSSTTPTSTPDAVVPPATVVTTSTTDVAPPDDSTTPDESTPTSPPPDSNPTPVSVPPPTDSSSTSFNFLHSFISEFISPVFAQTASTAIDSDTSTIILGPPLEADLASPTSSDDNASGTSDGVSTTPPQAPAPAPDADFLDVSYSTDGQTWVSVGTVNVNNFANFTVTIPVMNWADLQNLQMRVESIPTTQDPIPTVYLDGMIMEVHYEIPSELSAPDLTSDAPTVLLAPSSSVDVVSSKQDFGSDEDPIFTITDPHLTQSDIDSMVQDNQAQIISTTTTPTATSSTESSSVLDDISSFLGLKTALADAPVDILDATVLDSAGDPTTLTTTISDGQVMVNRDPRQFRPGRYILRVTIKTDDAVIISEQDFTWGVLAINSDKSIYQPGDDANIAMGVLNDQGHTICDAALSLTVTAPSGITQSFDSSQGQIQQSGVCAGDTKVDVPDYFTDFTVPNEIGIYQMTLTAVTANGSRTVESDFEVQADPTFDVERTAPTRIFPNDPYPVSMSITPVSDWSGTITETVPASFTITQSGEGTPYDHIDKEQSDTIISWNVHLHAGEASTLSYEFLAPPVSPEFYLIGPLEFEDANGSPVFQEFREWQIASDASCTSKTGTLNWNATASWNTGCSGTGGIPGTGDDVTISSGAVMTYNVTTTLSIHSLTFAAGTTATSLTSSSTVGALTITATGTAVTMNQPTGAVAYTWAINNGAVTLSAGSMSLPGTSATAGRTATITVTTGSLSVAGSITYGAQATAANAVVQTTGAGNITITGAETQAAGTLKTTSTGKILFGSSFQISSGNAATFACGSTGGISIGGSFTAQIAPTFTAGCVTTFTATGTITPTAAITFGDLTISGGTLTLAGSITVAGTWTNNSSASALVGGANTVTFATSGKTIGGTFPTSFPAVVILTSVAMTLNTSSTATSLTFNASALASSLTQGTGVNLAVSGDVTVNQPTAAVITAWDINAGTATVGGNLNYVGGSTTASRIAQVNVTTGSLSVTGTISFNGTDTTVANQVLSLTTGSITMNSNEADACATIKDTGAGTMIFNGTFSFGDPSCNPVFTSTSGETIKHADDVTATDALTYIAGSIEQFIGGSVTVTPTAAITFGDVQILSGTVSLSGNATVAGNWTNNSGASAFSGGTNTITFTGSSKNIAGTFGTTFPNIILASTAVINLNTSSTASSLMFATSTAASSLTNGTGIDLTLAGDVTINQGSAAKTTAWDINAGTATVGGNINIIAPLTTASDIVQVVVTTGSLTVDGTVSFTAGNTVVANQVLSYTSGTVSIGTDETLACGTIKNLTTAGTIIFNGAFNFGDPTCNPVFTTLTNGIVEHGGNITATDVLTYLAGTTEEFIDNSTVTPTVAITFGNVTIAAGTTTLAGNVTVAGNWTNNSGASAVGGTGVVSMTGAAKTIGGSFLSSFYGLTLVNGATITLATNATVGAGNLVIGNGGSTATSLTHNSGVDLTDSGSVTIGQPTGSATDAWDINAGTATVDGLVTLANTLTTATRIDKIALTTGTLNMNDGMTTGTGVGSSTPAVHVVDISGGAGTLTLLGALSTNNGDPNATGWTLTNTTCTSGGGTFVYGDTSPQTIYMPGSGGYCNLTADNSAGATLAAAVSATNLKGSLTVGDGTTAAILNNGSVNIVGAGTATFSVLANATFNMNGTTQIFPTGFGTFSFDPASFTGYYQTSAQTVSARNYGSLTLAPGATATYTLQAGSFGVQGDLTIGDGTNAATVTANTNDPTITVGGNVTISTSSTFIASNVNPISIGGDWTNEGTFNANTGNVTFILTNAVSTIIGTTSFYDLTITNASAKEVDFGTGGSPIYTVTDAFTVTGHAGNLIALRSDSSGTQWRFLPSGTASVNFADVKDAGCEAGAIQIDPTNSTNSHNNGSCWFGGPPIIFNTLLNSASNITLSPDATETISITASTTDSGGGNRLSYATGTIYRTSLGASCAQNSSNCYQIASSSCIFTNSTSTVTCSASIWYFAQSTGNPSSSFPSDSWEGAITVVDPGGFTATVTSSVENVNVLTAINLATSSISYGTIKTNTNTGSTNQTTTVQNAGNSSTTLQISGTAFVNGASTIATSSQHYSTTTFTFGGSELQLSGTATTIPGFVITAPTSTTVVQKNIFWGEGVPSGVATGTYTATSTFTAVFSN